MADESERDELDQGAALTLGGGDARLIRRQWHDGRWYFSVVDVVAVLTDSAEPRKYWAAMKARIQDEGFRELSAKCRQLKMRSADGKAYATDAADAETMLRIAQSIPSPKAEPVKQWLARAGAEKLQETADELAGLSEDQRRLYVRDQLAQHNKALAAAASDAGVVGTRDFAIFQDWGYRGMYAGERARDIAARKGLAKGQAILDHMGSEELAANLFRATQTEAKLRREPVQGKDAANQTHFTVGRQVREFIVNELGGTPPEELPTPPDSVQQVRKREQRRIEGERQPSLFEPEDGDAGGES